MPERILVTGAAGTTGRELVSLLAETDARVRAGVHSHGSVAGDSRFQSVEVVTMELTDPDSLVAAFEDVDVAYLLTPFVPSMVELTENLVDAAVGADVEYLVRHSAVGAGDDPPYTLAKWHRDAERIVEESGADYAHLRPTAFMQNLLGDAETIRESGRFSNVVGEAAIAFVDARDVALVARSVLLDREHAGDAYPITGPEALTYHEVADRLSASLGREIAYDAISERRTRGALRTAGLPPELVDGILSLQSWFAAGHGSEVVDTVERLTGEEPRTFTEFLDDYGEAFR